MTPDFNVQLTFALTNNTQLQWEWKTETGQQTSSQQSLLG